MLAPPGTRLPHVTQLYLIEPKVDDRNCKPLPTVAVLGSPP
ncbi:hypothetical protein [Acrocarpospora sp. B8E8]